MQLDARFMARLGCAVAANSHVACRHAAHPARIVVQHLGGGEAGIDFDAQGFGLLAQPAGEIAQADDVIAVVIHLWRRRQANSPGWGQKQESIIGRRRIERGAAVYPIGQKLVERAGLDHRAG